MDLGHIGSLVHISACEIQKSLLIFGNLVICQTYLFSLWNDVIFTFNKNFRKSSTLK